MSKGNKIIQAASEALAFARGEQSAARLTVNGHTYVPLANISKAVLIERERCAKIADDVQKSMHEECDFGAGIVATAIRAAID